MKRVTLASMLAACLLWAQPGVPSATINQDITTGQITVVVSVSKVNRTVCKYTPIPLGGPYTTLNINCVVNGKPSAVYYVQLNNPFQAGVEGETFGINANGNQAITAIFTPVAAVPPGTAQHIGYAIAANGASLTGAF